MNYVPKNMRCERFVAVINREVFQYCTNLWHFHFMDKSVTPCGIPLELFFRKRNANWFIRSRRATQSFTFLPSGENGETEFSTEFIQGPFNDTMTDEEAHRLLSSGRTRSLPSIQRVIDRKEKQIAKKKATRKSKLSVQNDRLTKLWILFPKNGR